MCKSVKLNNIKPNPNNPRLIKDDKFKKLVKSIQDFPEMMEKRPIVCVTDTDGKLYPLGGNMRLKAIQEIGYKDIPDTWVVLADEWTVEQRNEFVIKDNVGFGEWDWEQLANEWDAEKLDEWGLDIEQNKKEIKEEHIVEYEQSIQLIPSQEYILVVFENDEQFEQAKIDLNLKLVRRGGYKKDSPFDAVSIERVLYYSDLKNRIC
jgi:hypothetical protein